MKKFSFLLKTGLIFSFFLLAISGCFEGDNKDDNQDTVLSTWEMVSATPNAGGDTQYVPITNYSNIDGTGGYDIQYGAAGYLQFYESKAKVFENRASVSFINGFTGEVKGTVYAESDFEGLWLLFTVACSPTEESFTIPLGSGMTISISGNNLTATMNAATGTLTDYAYTKVDDSAVSAARDPFWE
ncbi:MAG: hypothetical protein GY754_16540 [bacterium]|nr:hypothetical protein [bacterium]